MGSGHNHGQTSGHAAGRAHDRSRLRLVLLVTASVAVLELVGALLSGSLALLADAGHMFTDTAAVVLAPVVAGGILGLGFGYSTLYLVAAAVSVLGSVLVVNIKSLP